MIKQIDYQGNNQINYSEFLAATIDISKFLTDDKLSALFKTFDIDDTGYITKENLKDSFSKLNREITP